ncbi:MAG: multicopper oxidase domain-containing protein [Microthrixaceae bacterium]|nr:multicopper oxidase domain-containing protein [Acidimicrobiales bacterium]MCB9402935.1 multicopper oxidase domain-containing protein [Microthrixaceae bacterium]
MSPASQTMLSRFAVVTSIFALVMVGVVAATRPEGGSGTSGPGAPVAVALSEFAISPATVTVPKGGSIAVTNNGSVAHNVGVTDTALKTRDLNGGETDTLDLSELDPGTYELYCAVSGHKEAGMTAVLIITDGSAGAAEEAAGAETSHHEDISTLDPSDAQAQRINKQFEDDMNAGVKTFLEYAEKYANGEIETGNQPIEPEIEADGTKVFNLTAEITDWEVSPGKTVKAWTYNGRVPGPWIKVDPGDKIKVNLTNKLPISTDIHWHGIDVPFEQDGVAPITQDYIRPLETYTYEFTVQSNPGLGMYHAHMHGQTAIVNGLFAIFQVGDAPLPTGRTIGNVAIPEDLNPATLQQIPMVLNDAGVIGLSLNGKSFPATQPIAAKKDEWFLIHFFNEGLQGHPMHLHRQPQIVVAKDGFALDAPYRMDTLWVSPGERYTALVKAEDPGKWAFHCHIVSHAENDQGLFGMVTVLIVE